VERVSAPDCRLRSQGSDPDPGLADSRLLNYRSSLSFYAVVTLLLSALWLLT
jgi:hypothetical protein